MEPVSIIQADAVSDAVAELYSRISVELRSDVQEALRAALDNETSDVAAGVLRVLLRNEEVSCETRVPLCQDTGLAIAFVRMGSRVIMAGATLQEAIDEGVRRAARGHPLRRSTVAGAFDRRNLGDNTPAIVHLEQVRGDELEISLMAKGGGAENMSRVHMLAPGQGRAGIVEAVVETVRKAGANPCPPVIVGVGLGGNFERCALLAKRALMRDMGQPNPDPALAELEAELLERINALGIGPQGFGGGTTALAVLALSEPCHIASMPLAVNVECHSHRHGTVVLKGQRHDLT